MRAALIPLLLLAAADVLQPDRDVTPLKGLTTFERSSGTQRDAETILKEMRQALGGEAALAAVKSLSMTASGQMTVKGKSMPVADEYFLVIPDHYLRVRRLMPNMSEPLRSRVSDSALFEGFRGDQLIRRIGDRHPPAAPDGDRLALAKWRHDAARLLLALAGRTLPGYPMTLGSPGTEEITGISYDIVEGRGPDGVVMRLYVDAKTHLPDMVATTGLEKTPDTNWFLSDFKKVNGLNWPGEIEEQVEGALTEVLQIRSWKVNPRLDSRMFAAR